MLLKKSTLVIVATALGLWQTNHSSQLLAGFSWDRRDKPELFQYPGESENTELAGYIWDKRNQPGSIDNLDSSEVTAASYCGDEPNKDAHQSYSAG